MIAQISRFAGVGALATLVHMIFAILVFGGLNWAPQTANFCGFAAAVSFSYIGHGMFTFGTRLEHRNHMPKFIAASGIALLLSSVLTHVIVVWFGAPFELAMVLVAVAVPVSSFLMYKFLVFAKPQSEGP